PPAAALALFPYTTLFRSRRELSEALVLDVHDCPKRALAFVVGAHVLHRLQERILVVPQVDIDRFRRIVTRRRLWRRCRAQEEARSEEHTSELQSRENLVC